MLDVRKNQIRQEMRKRRKTMTLSETDKKELITHFQTLISNLQPPIIASYEKMGSEIDPSFLNMLGFTIVLPEIMDNETMSFSQTPDIIVLPLIAFDRKGNRLGQGGGYYDRYLAKSKALHVGLAYTQQEVPNLPVEPHDQKLDWIITPKEVIKT
jgi:5-formyltetrahydrofolate cyclo-ligase